jgi:hypothetical protein
MRQLGKGCHAAMGQLGKGCHEAMGQSAGHSVWGCGNGGTRAKQMTEVASMKLGAKR